MVVRRILACGVLGLGVLLAFQFIRISNRTEGRWGAIGLVFIIPGALLVVATLPQAARYRRLLAGLGYLALAGLIGFIAYALLKLSQLE